MALTAIKAVALRAGVAIDCLSAPGIPRREAPDLHVNHVNDHHGRVKQWVRRVHGVANANLPD